MSAAAAAAAVPDLPSPSRDAGAAALPSSGTFAPLVKKAAPAVVSVQSTRTAKIPAVANMPRGGSPFDFFFGPNGPNGPQEMPQERRQRGLGSGVIFSSDGYILTNHHVIEDADEVKVQLSDDREFPAKIIGSDSKTDVAVLKIDAHDLPTLPLGNSEAVEVGDIVLAIGNPFGIGQTVTMGIVGATGREFGIMAQQAGYEDFIQTDAAINPGNSGGALINTRGELVGINTAILSRSGGNQGVGFAVPVNLAHHVTKQLVENGRVERGFMGVGIQDISSAMEKTLDTPDSHGAVVTNVNEGGPAAKAGLEQYDVIRSVDGRKIRDARELRLAVANHAPGDTVEVAVLRGGAAKTMNVTLGEFPKDDNAEAGEEQSATSGALEGVSVDNLSAQVAEQLGLDSDIKGVVVTRVRPDSPAAEAGLQSGLVIQEVNRKPVRNVDEFRSAMGTVKKGEAVMLLVHVRGGSRFVVVEP
ncbi:MAG: DegQ family serine endoprotease [Bryobacterales bacterium]|nr:DegQ family serine endoprotease [Bryobacterales bacterium]